MFGESGKKLKNLQYRIDCYIIFAWSYYSVFLREDAESSLRNLQHLLAFLLPGFSGNSKWE